MQSDAQLKCYFHRFHFSVGQHAHTRAHSCTHTHTHTHTHRFSVFSLSVSHPCLSASPRINGPYTQLLLINLPLNILTPLRQHTHTHTHTRTHTPSHHLTCCPCPGISGFSGTQHAAATLRGSPAETTAV